MGDERNLRRRQVLRRVEVELICQRQIRDHRLRARGTPYVQIGLDLFHNQRMTLTELADRIDAGQLFHPEDWQARAIRFSTVDAICKAPSCQPGDILRFEPEHAEGDRRAAGGRRQPTSALHAHVGHGRGGMLPAARVVTAPVCRSRWMKSSLLIARLAAVE